MIAITNRWTGDPLRTVEAADLREAVTRLAGKGADLRDANLRDANLWGADLRDANLQGADLWGANLWGANLWDANLRDANLRDANLRGANLRGANLRGADLWDTNLRGANLWDTNLRGANLRDANLQGANLRGANLQGANLPAYVPAPAPDLAQLIALAVVANPATLCMEQWHTCETTHCLAGWAITLTPGGKELESRVGPATAGALLLPAASHLFYASNDEALAWLQAQLPTDEA